MTQHPVTMRDKMPVDYHMFYLSEEEGRGAEDCDWSNGLISVEPGFAVIQTGVAGGDVRLTVEVHRQAPPVEPNDWEEVVEVSLKAMIGRMVVAAVMSDVPEFPVLTPNGPGSYRVRVHALGRDTAVDTSPSEPVEDYLIQVWPAPAGPQAIYKYTDAYGASFRRYAAGKKSAGNK